MTILAEKAVQNNKALCEAGIQKTAAAQKQQIVALTSAIQSIMKVMGCTHHPKKPLEVPKKPWSGGSPKGPKPPFKEKSTPKCTTWKKNLSLTWGLKRDTERAAYVLLVH